MEDHRDNSMIDESYEESQSDRAQVGAGGILAGNLTAGSSASGIMSGMVGGGPASGVAAQEANEEEGTGVGELNLDALDDLDGLGNRRTETGDDSISPQQAPDT